MHHSGLCKSRRRVLLVVVVDMLVVWVEVKQQVVIFFVLWNIELLQPRATTVSIFTRVRRNRIIGNSNRPWSVVIQRGCGGESDDENLFRCRGMVGQSVPSFQATTAVDPSSCWIPQRDSTQQDPAKGGQGKTGGRGDVCNGKIQPLAVAWSLAVHLGAA